MGNRCKYLNLKITTLIVLRLLVGWHIFYEGVAKLLNPNWSSAGFLEQSQGVFSGFASWVVSNPDVLSVVEFLNTWGLIAIGLGLVLGLFSQAAAIAGAVLVFVYYLCTPPIIGFEYTLPAEGNNLIVNKTLIEAAALAVLAMFPTSSVFGLDSFRNGISYKRDILI